MGFCTILSATYSGMDVDIINVEADIRMGLPMFLMVGYLSSEVKEAADRVRTAINNTCDEFPIKNVTVNLSPVSIRKRGAAFDLPVAISILAADGRFTLKDSEHTLFVGELGLNGNIRKVKGILPIVLKAKETGIKRCFVPKENEKEGSLVEGIQVVGVENLKDVVLMLQGKKKIVPGKSDVFVEDDKIAADVDFKDIYGQENVKRAAIISVAGGHNILMQGPPGSGKSLIAKAMAGILPPMDMDEIFEVTKVYSIAGMLSEKMPYVNKRPFRSVTHTATKSALYGGGVIPVPGEISLAHKGILFLDELPEFRKEVIEVLREPLEENKVLISRNHKSYEYPACIILVVATNPCPCGYYPDLNKCKCKQNEIDKYKSKISGPIMDRIDLYVEAKKVDYETLKGKTSAKSSKEIREEVKRVRNIQSERYKNEEFKVNGRIPGMLVDKYCGLDKKSEELMKNIYDSFNITARSYHKILKVARTIADIDGEENININHLMEAVAYRTGDV